MTAPPDRLPAAIAAALPLLRELRDTLGRQPAATTAALARLVALAPLPLNLPLPLPLPPRDPAAEPSEEGRSSESKSGSEGARDSRRAAAPLSPQPAIAATTAENRKVVFGVGNPAARIMFVGDDPEADDNPTGEPFVGKAGQLLTKIIQTMGYSRETVYLGNVLKCRLDRSVAAAETLTTQPSLAEHIGLIRPEVLVALGTTAIESLLGPAVADRSMGQLRGQWFDFQGIPVMATYHPAYLLRNQSLGEKRKVWEDMLLVLERLGDPITEKQRGFFLPR